MVQKPGFLYLFTFGMTAMYVAIGLFMIFSERAAEMFPGWRHSGIGVLLFVYAAYRIFRLKKLRQQMENEQ
jgi:hypothetical protein